MCSTNTASDADYINAVLERSIKHKFAISTGLASLLQRRKPIRSVMYSKRMMGRARRGHWRGPNSYPDYAGGWVMAGATLATWADSRCRRLCRRGEIRRAR